MMKHLVVIFLVLFAIQKQGILVQVEAENGFVQTRGVQFILNGSPYYANGLNAYWLMYMASQPSQRDKVSSAFQQAADHDLNIVRTWAFSDGGDNPLQYSPGSYNEQMFQGLDFVVCEAGKHGIKLVLSLVNNYADYGGRKQYVEWARSRGQAISSEDDFYTNPVVKGYYKNHIKTVLTRRNTLTGIAYKDDRTVMSWELMNEPRCPSDQSGRTIQAWITEMASYLKSIDGKHLLEVGLEGFYGKPTQFYPNYTLVGTDFITDNQIPGIDFATAHYYPDQWLPGSSFQSILSFLRRWMDNHIHDAQNTLKKPVMFTEFGLDMKKFIPSQRDQLYETVYSKIYSTASGGGAAAGGLFWQLLSEGMDSFRDGYELILSETSSTVNLISEEAKKLIGVQKMYARPRNIEKLKKAREIRRAPWSASNNVNTTGN